MLIQWLDSDKFGKTEEAELRSESIQQIDPITGNDILVNVDVVFAGGFTYPTSDNGKRFIITNAPLSEFDLIEIKGEIGQKPIQDQSDPLGYNSPQETKKVQQKVDKFVIDLYTRAKKRELDVINTTLRFTIPTSEAMMSFESSFDDKTIEDLIGYIVDSFDETELKKQLKNSLYKHYNIT